MAEHESQASLRGERPLGRGARALLVVNAAFTILLFYLTAIVFIAGFGCAALTLLVVTMAAARFGLASHVGRLMQPPVRLMGILGRKLWLSSGPTYRIMLAPQDAPALFEITRTLAQRAALAPPRSIAIEMHNNAWVQLHGYRSGRGRTNLGIGFDLLAGLTVSEVEAVLAHELTHARLVQRGFSRWLKKGMARLGQVTNELAVCAASYRQANAWSNLADTTFGVFDRLTRRASRLVATYSRQNEFEADRGGVELCGAAAMRSALLRLETLNDRVNALPWAERLARLQPGEAFTAWLVGELSAATPQSHLPQHAVDHYSTHPALRDRLAAMPAAGTALRDTRPGIALLADPDAVATRLIVEIQRVVALQEARDTKRLARDTRKFCRRRGIGVARGFGIIALLIGLVYAIAAISDAFPLDQTIFATALLVGGVALFRIRYRDRRPLPIPAFGTLLNPRPPETPEQLRAAEQAIVTELRAAAAREANDRARSTLLVNASYAALEQRDYLRAHVAARLALELDGKAVEGGIAYAIAAAGLGNVQQMQSRILYLRNKIGLHTPALQWGAAWAFSLLPDWSCEGLLQQLHERSPGVATYASLLALAQMNRGKLHSAIGNAERAVALDPTNRTAVLLLCQLLLLVGRAADAATRLEPWQDQVRTDVNAAFLMVRLKLMQRDAAKALEWSEIVRTLDGEGAYLLGLGHVFSAARLPDPAAGFFAQAAEAQFTPEANIGLSIVAWLRGDPMVAKGHLLSALRFEGAKFTKGQTVNALFHEILGRLNGLAEERLECRAWVAAIPNGPLQLGGRSLLVCAQSETAARLHLETIVSAMQGGQPDLSRVSWRLASQDQQPDRPVPPGVHSVIA
jgi:Zn-dependent protease with chaperone function